MVTDVINADGMVAFRDVKRGWRLHDCLSGRPCKFINLNIKQNCCRDGNWFVVGIMMAFHPFEINFKWDEKYQFPNDHP